MGKIGLLTYSSKKNEDGNSKNSTLLSYEVLYIIILHFIQTKINK